MDAYGNLTTEETKAVEIIRDMLSNTVNPARITIGEAKTYLPVMLDSNKFRPICRLYFKQNKYIGTISDRRVETKNMISNPDDIRAYQGEITHIVRKYLS